MPTTITLYPQDALHILEVCSGIILLTLYIWGLRKFFKEGRFDGPPSCLKIYAIVISAVLLLAAVVVAVSLLCVGILSVIQILQAWNQGLWWPVHFHY